MKQQKSELGTIKPKMGRPVKRPNQSKLAQLGFLSFEVDAVRAILNESRKRWPTMSDKLKSLKISAAKGKDGKPEIQSNWQAYTPAPISDDELGLIFQFFRLPEMIDATQKPKTKIERMLLKSKTAAAIQWAKLFADAPRMMIDALPKIQKILEKCVGNPRQKVIHHFCRMNEIQRFLGPISFCETFWTDPPNIIADKLKVELREPAITAKTIEHARAILNENLRSFPRKSPKIR